jgi:hypothetical protein
MAVGQMLEVLLDTWSKMN